MTPQLGLSFFFLPKRSPQPVQIPALWPALLCSEGVQGVSGLSSGPDNKGWCVCQLSSAPMCHQCGVPVEWGEGWGGQKQKNREIKEHNNTFFFFFNIIYYVQSMCETDPHKTHENNTLEEHNTQGSLCFRHPCRFCFTRSSRVKHRPKAWHRRYSWEVWELINSWKKFQ